MAGALLPAPEGRGGTDPLTKDEKPEISGQDYKYGNQTLSHVAAEVGDSMVDGQKAQFEVTTYADGLDFLTAHEFLPDGRMVIGEKGGKVLIRAKDGTTTEAGTLSADTFGARGLLNVILHPDFAKNRRLLFYYSVKEAPDHDKQQVVSIPLGPDNRLQMDQKKVLVRGLHGAQGYEQGGGLLIGADGMLYVGVGDGGWRAGKPAEPPYEPTNYFGTCLSNGNGKILRLHPDGTIPADNPLVNTRQVPACGDVGGTNPATLGMAEPRRDIWVWGVRNPWRLWSDPKTGHMWFVDDGDITHEEVNVMVQGRGHHFGWPWREGAAGHPVKTCAGGGPGGKDCVEPAYYCKHGESENGVDGGCQSMGGGLGVDDERWPLAQRDKFYFGDCSNGWIWSLDFNENRDGIVAGSRRDFARVGGLIVDMDLGPDGAMYVGVLELPPEKSRIVRIAPRQKTAAAAPAPEPAAAGGTNEPAAAATGEAATDGLPGGDSLLLIVLGLALFLALLVGVLIRSRTGYLGDGT